MKRRPWPVAVISWLLIATGIIGIAHQLTEFDAQQPFQSDMVWVCLVSLIAILCGAYMLRGSNWARWLTLVWIGYHVILSGFHSLFELVVHALLFALFAYVLFRPEAREYFRPA